MPSAASKAPKDYLFALVVCVVVVAVSFKVSPSETRWIVFTVGVLMGVAVLMAAVRPSRN
jgi:protein-S-isoprenylcysteine O-methyltransferase Ste14